MVRKQGSNLARIPSRDKHRFLNHPAAAWALSEGILMLAEVANQESVQAGTGRASKHQQRCEWPHDDPKRPAVEDCPCLFMKGVYPSLRLCVWWGPGEPGALACPSSCVSCRHRSGPLLQTGWK